MGPQSVSKVLQSALIPRLVSNVNQESAEEDSSIVLTPKHAKAASQGIASEIWLLASILRLVIAVNRLSAREVSHLASKYRNAKTVKLGTAKIA